MKILRPLRMIFLALLVTLVPASSFAGVYISVSFAPPILPVYEQPPCPEEGLMWVPGYWAYDQDGYYWVPGTWVPAPYEGALWTPPYWGWESGFYMFHPGYWGRHVGYYGGVNYGFGYMGVGFVGGMWRGHNFEYNTAVMHVDERRIHDTYRDRGIVERNTIANSRRVSFSGGRDGIHHDPRPEERLANRDQHMGATSFQHSQESSAMADRSQYVKNNGGRPSFGATERPLGKNGQGGPSLDRGRPGQNGGGAPMRNQQDQGRGTYQGGQGNQGRGNYNPAPDNRGVNNPRPSNNPSQNNANPGGGSFNNPRNTNPNPDSRNFNNQPGNGGNAPTQPAPQYRQAPQTRSQPQPEFRQTPQQRPAPEFRQAPQQRPAPQAQPRPAPQQHATPEPQQHDQGQHRGDHGEKGDHQH